MGFKLISKKLEGEHQVYNILGIKLKFFNGKEIKKKVIENKYSAYKHFLYAYSKDMTTNDKIRVLSQIFYERAGYYPNLKKPKTFNEKLNWMRFNYKNPIKKFIIDKYKFKNYIEENLGENYTIPLIKVFDDINDIDFNELPETFVVKTTKGFGRKAVKIIKDKNKIQLDKLKYELSCCLNKWDGVVCNGFFVNSPITEKIIVEAYCDEISTSQCDYKFWCFHGEPKLIAAMNYAQKEDFKIAFYDTSWNKLDLHIKYKKDSNTIKKPKNFDKMMDFARKLSEKFPFVRVDLYDIGTKVYVGELTFLPTMGMAKYGYDWDYKLGEWLDLSKIPPEHLKILPEFAEGAKTFIAPQIVESCTVVRERE